uniref:ZFYVE26-like TPR repeats domain-containing protein n=1 Tax=Noccaea caerulescens TaxID=107243 RepID=A0A1J3CB32_NOCCA
MDKETEILSRLAANHLHLAQFEPLKATLLALRVRNPDLALTILQTIVSNAGRFENVLWSRSCSSPSLLAFLSTIELLRFENPTSPWGFDSETLSLRADFLLMVQVLIDRVTERIREEQRVELESESENDESEKRDENGGLRNCVRVLQGFLELGVERLKFDVDTSSSGGSYMIEEEEFVSLRSIVLDYSDVFDALCCNIKRQLVGSEGYVTSLVDEVERGEEEEERKEGVGIGSREQDNNNVFALIQRNVQLAQLDAMRKCLDEEDEHKAAERIRYLHLDYGVENENYHAVLKALLSRVMEKKDEYGDSWHMVRQKLLFIYKEALSSNCGDLVQMIQGIQDDMLLPDSPLHLSLDNDQIPFPLECFRRYLLDLKTDRNIEDKSSPMSRAINSCLRDMYHYARISGSHVLECVMCAALSSVKKEKLQDASDVLALFPRLRPLVASMGWDLLPGKTATRRKLMRLLWTSNSQAIRLEESSLYGNQTDEKSCVEHLCDTLCYQLELASFAACVNSGKSWTPKASFLMHGNATSEHDDAEVDPFVENLVLERLSAQSPLRVLFDVVPGIKFQEAISLISMQPIASTAEAWKRIQDIELMHMRYALEAIVLALGAMEEVMKNEMDASHRVVFYHLKDLTSHLEAIKNVPRKIMMVNIVISLLHIDDIRLSSARCFSSECFSEKSNTPGLDNDDLDAEGEKEIVISFIRQLLNVLRRNLPAHLTEQECQLDGNYSAEGRQALEWRVSMAKRFIEDCEWRLSVMQHLLPLSERQWGLKEVLSVLRAAPAKLLNLCMQRAKYDIGEQAVHRFALSAEDKATLELAEWVDNAFNRTLVEDVMSRAAEGESAVQDLDFRSLGSQLSPLALILLCIDAAASSAKSPTISKQLLDKSQVMLSEIYPGGSPKVGFTYWDQVHEVAIISVLRRILKRLQEFLEQDNPQILQASFSGDTIIASCTESHRQGQKDRALAMLHQMIEDAHRGKRQFLSGKLHNLARAIADEKPEVDVLTGDGTDMTIEKDGVLGLGLKYTKQSPSGSANRDVDGNPVSHETEDKGKRSFGPLSNKSSTYLSQFILYIAAIGDIVDGTDTTHDFNFFSLVYEWPKDLLTRLVFDRGSTESAAKVAEVMSADFVHEVISACVPPVYPPRSGHGWACIPVIPTTPSSHSESKVLSPSKEAKPNCYVRSSATPGVPLYPLQLDIIKHLVKISPVRAVLACVFGGSILYNGSDSVISSSLNDEFTSSPDEDRLFYEFSLDQSERFPTLNRWIQMETNLHRVSEFVVTPKQKPDDTRIKPDERTGIKRLLEHDSDSESDAEEVFSNNIQPALTDSSARDGGPFETGISRTDPTVFLSFDWENEVPYEKAVNRLIDEGKLMDALALSDRFLRNGASDWLLQLLIKSREENPSTVGRSQGQSIWSNSWQYCLRLKDKQLAATLALKYMHTWELDAALNVLTMCSCHLLESDPISYEVLQRRQALQKYSHILSADDRHNSWQEVEAECKEDPEGLALRLAGKGAVSAALEVAESAGLSIDLRRELQGRQLVKLLTTDPLNGGGPAEASRFLSSLQDSADALPVVMGAMQLLPDLRSKQLLVHFFLKRRDSNLSESEVARLNSWALGLKVLAALPLPWQQRCSSLHEHPHLIVEALLMRKQLQYASLILKEFPALRDNNVIMAYASKAIAVTINPPPREPRITVSASRLRQKPRAAKASFTSSLSNFQREARRAFSWTPRNAENRTTSKDVHRKRKNSGLGAPERAAWEAMTGIPEEQGSSYSVDGQNRLPSVSIAEEWMLTGQTAKDEAVRASHKYESTPDIILFKALLSLCSDELVSARSAIDLCINQMKNVLSSKQLSEGASVETIGRAYHATEAFVQGLSYAKSLLRKLLGATELTNNNSERSRDVDDISSDTGSSSVGSQATDEPSEVLSLADIWLGRAELLQSLLGSGISASLDDIADQLSSECLRDRLISDERYSMAVYMCKKCKIDVFPVWKAWGLALLRMERYAQARVKFKQAFQLKGEDIPDVIQEIINTIEGGPPVDVSTVRSMYDHLAKSAPTILDDSLSADSYLNVLHMPSTFPRSERSRRSLESEKNNSVPGLDFDDGPRSNLDSTRYSECTNYLQEHARPNLLGFMFRHGHFKDACMLFFPPSALPPPLQTSSAGAVSSSSSPQRTDPLATEYGTIENLCEFCVGYGAISSLEEVITERLESAKQQDQAINQYIAGALTRICVFLETNRHFNYLYKFLVLKKDYVTSGYCCIQLFMNSTTQEEAVRHLERAQAHFDEALTARLRGSDSKKIATKGVRGKSAVEKLSQEALLTLATRVKMQIDVVKSFSDSEGAPWKQSLFGNPNDSETSRRRCEIVETLVEKNFDLAFQVIYEFKLSAVDIYAGVAASLADRKKGSQLTELFKNVKGTIEDDDWDQVLGAAISVYANKHKERPDRLIDMLTSSHRKVLACVVCGRLKSAFQIAAKSGSVADVQYVAHQALHANSLTVLDMCKQWLAQYM